MNTTFQNEGGSTVLTKDLVKFSRRKDRIYPLSIKVDKQDLLELASDLISLYAHGEGKNREELEEESSIIVNSSSQVLIARGLNRLCLDRSEFTQCLEIDFPKAREELFDLSSATLKLGLDYDTFREKVESKAPQEYQSLLHEDLYGSDLHSYTHQREFNYDRNFIDLMIKKLYQEIVDYNFYDMLLMGEVEKINKNI